MSTTEYPRQPADPGRRLAVPPSATTQAAPGDLPEDPFPDRPPDLAAAEFAARAKRRARTLVHRRFSRLLGRRRVAHRRLVTALVTEHDQAGRDRDPDRATHGETVVQGIGKAGADAELARFQRRLERHARGTDQLRARQAELQTRASQRSADRVRHPDGGQRPVAEVQRDEAAARHQIEAEAARGSRKHQRLPRWIGRIPVLVLLADFCLLLYFFSGITDVDWSSPLGANLVFAVLLAAMVTVLSYGFLAFAGHRLRGYKDHSGAVAFGNLDALTKAACWAAVAGIVMLSTLMFIRMRAEVLYALGPGGWITALVIALALAVVSVLANFLVVAIHALDGSHEVARLNALSAALAGPLGRAHELDEQAAVIPHRIAVRRRSAHRAAVTAITQAGQHMSAADQAIVAARAAHQGTGPHGSLPADPNQHPHVLGYRDPASIAQADLRPMHAALDHIDTGLPQPPD
jgi:hypothetical protein